MITPAVALRVFSIKTRIKTCTHNVQRVVSHLTLRAFSIKTRIKTMQNIVISSNHYSESIFHYNKD